MTDPDQDPAAPAQPDHPTPNSSSTSKGSGPALGDVMAMGMTAALCLIGGLGMGLALDAWTHIAPIGVFLGLGFGILATVGAVVRQVRRML